MAVMLPEARSSLLLADALVTDFVSQEGACGAEPATGIRRIE